MRMRAILCVALMSVAASCHESSEPLDGGSELPDGGSALADADAEWDGAPDPCAAHSSCDACVRDSRCGYCAIVTGGRPCMRGNSSGPLYASCHGPDGTWSSGGVGGCR